MGINTIFRKKCIVFVSFVMVLTGCISGESLFPQKNRKDAYGVEMVLVPEGEFTMGVNPDELEYTHEGEAEDETPAHIVYLSAYYIDKYEITNAEYQACVNDSICASLEREERRMRLYPDKENIAKSPVMYLSWQDAQNYCEWRGTRLPTEAEWEKAARGTDERIYPWGNEIDCSYANYGLVNIGPRCGNGYIFPVGSYAKGISPYGAYDMAGNVSEWVQDCYIEDFYSQVGDESVNPLATGDADCGRILRGDSAFSNPYNVRTFARNLVHFEYRDYYSGVRCAWSP